MESYPTRYPAPGWAEQQPEEVLQASLRGIRRALEQAPSGDCAALVFSGTMNGCIAIDEAGEALFPNIIHSDLRAAPQVEAIEERIAELDRLVADYADRKDNLASCLKALVMGGNLEDEARGLRHLHDILQDYLES